MQYAEQQRTPAEQHRLLADFQRAKNNPLIRIASADGITTLECLSFGERDSLVDHINYVKDDGRSGAAAGSGKVSGPHAAAKQQLLDSDRWASQHPACLFQV